ncbi:hypothetical protein C8Q79DRAFT_1008500 [Trametes meyenii]|nr:hypothetical protein C8Q79DRAFT_1008500 [Trametes meyenii]
MTNEHNPKYRTKLCRNFPLGKCRYGEYCSYLHVSPAPSPISQYPAFPTMSTVAQTIFQPCANYLYHDPLSLPFSEPAPSVPSPQWTVENRRDARTPRNTRTDGGRRARGSPPHIQTHNQTSVHVEKWRLSVDTVREPDVSYPSAPPTTPTSASTSGSPMRAAQHRDERGRTRGDRPIPAPLASVSALPLPAFRPQSAMTVATARPRPPSISTTVLRAQKRNQFFRTKPCRFFAESTGCVKGDRCNFIHESPEDGSLPTGLPAPAEALSEGEVESVADSSIQGELSPCTVATSEPLSAHTEEPKRNFYPVTWRVVGGGVTLGGKREICENFMAGRCSEGVDCKYAHPDSSEDECVYGYPEPPLFSPLSPISPVLVPYPFMYPVMSPLQPFALPAVPGPAPATPPPTIQPAPTPRAKPTAHSAKSSLTNLTVVTTMAHAQPAARPHSGSYLYSPHRVVDGGTLLERELAPARYRVDGMWAATRAVARPLSTPPTPVHGPDAGIAKLFAAEMP